MTSIYSEHSHHPRRFAPGYVTLYICGGIFGVWLGVVGIIFLAI